jgi:phospholipase/lecithinase/hemolysin
MKKTCSSWTIVWLAVLALGGSLRAAPWTGLYVFGDSYSDSGTGYVDINGPTSVVYLARSLELPFTYSRDPQRAGKSLNFAVSGAQTGEGLARPIKNSFLEYGMKNQVEDFVALVKLGVIRFDPARTIFFLAGGLNDRRLSTETTIANLTALIRTLHATGARHFFVALLPTKIPSFSAVGLRLNPALAQIPAQLKLDGATIRISRWGEYFDAVMENPARHGILNTTDACAGRALFDEDTTEKGNPDTYFYYHQGHPSTAVHKIVAEGLLKEMREAEPK